MTETFDKAEAKPFLTLPEPIEDPQAVIIEFFRQFHLEDAQEFFWEVCKGALASPLFDDAYKRLNTLFFAELMVQLFRAIQQIHAPNASWYVEPKPEPGGVINDAEIETSLDAYKTILTEFFSAFSLQEIEHELERWLKVSLCSDSAEYQEGKERGNLISLHNQLRDLLRSLYKGTGQTEKS